MSNDDQQPEPPQESYRLEFVRCGKTRCRKCRDGPGHGPYWYAYRREGSKVRKRYIGRQLPPLPGTEQRPDDRHPAVKRFKKEAKLL